MKELVKGFIKWLIIVLATLTLIVWVFIFTAFCQSVYDAARPRETTHPPHKTLEDFEESIGFRYVVAMSKDSSLLFYKKDYKNRIHLGSFGYDKFTKFVGNYEGTLCVLYCKTHQFAYIVAPCEEK